MKISIPGFIHAKPDYSGKTINYSFWPWDQMDGERMLVPHTIEVEIGNPLDPIALAIEELERMKDIAGKEFSAKVNEINERLAKLTAIGHEEPSL